MNVRIDRWAGLLVALALISTISVVSASASTPETGEHEAHHSGTPIVSVCDAIGEDATSGMMMGTPGGGMMHGDMAMGTPGAGDHAMMIPADQFDLMFIDMMIPHHESAVVMAQIALERSEREEIRRLAEEIITTQSAEIVLLREWRDRWYPGAPEMPMAMMNEQMMDMMAAMPDMPTMPGGGMMAGMDMAAEAIALCNAPEPFDLAFIDAMIPHHESAVAMANVALEHSTHEEMIAFHQAVIDVQQREIDQMRAWRDAWFGPATPTA